MYSNMLKSEAELDYSNTTNALFICEKCDYQSHKTSNYNKHLLTAKHKQNILDNFNCNDTKIYNCTCGNIYKHRQGLWKHKHVSNCGTIVTNNELKIILTEILATIKHN